MKDKKYCPLCNKEMYTYIGGKSEYIGNTVCPEHGIINFDALKNFINETINEEESELNFYK